MAGGLQMCRGDTEGQMCKIIHGGGVGCKSEAGSQLDTRRAFPASQHLISAPLVLLN